MIEAAPKSSRRFKKQKNKKGKSVMKSHLQTTHTHTHAAVAAAAAADGKTEK